MSTSTDAHDPSGPLIRGMGATSPALRAGRESLSVRPSEAA
jgi:hypothetical protein